MKVTLFYHVPKMQLIYFPNKIFTTANHYITNSTKNFPFNEEYKKKIMVQVILHLEFMRFLRKYHQLQNTNRVNQQKSFYLLMCPELLNNILSNFHFVKEKERKSVIPQSMKIHIYLKSSPQTKSAWYSKSHFIFYHLQLANHLQFNHILYIGLDNGMQGYI